MSNLLYHKLMVPSNTVCLRPDMDVPLLTYTKGEPNVKLNKPLFIEPNVNHRYFCFMGIRTKGTGGSSFHITTVKFYPKHNLIIYFDSLGSQNVVHVKQDIINHIVTIFSLTKHPKFIHNIGVYQQPHQKNCMDWCLKDLKRNLNITIQN